MAVARGTLTATAIVEQAVEIADADGLAGLSMRTIADRLGVGVMSLYRHVANKDQLVELMVEQVGERYFYPDHDGRSWRESLLTLAEVDWTMYLAHPWTLTATFTSRPPVGPSTVRAMEWALAAVAELGLPPADAVAAIWAVSTHVQGVALLAVAELSQREAEISVGDYWQRQVSTYAGDRYRHVWDAAESVLRADPRTWLDSDLGLLLDGIERLAERRRGTSADSGPKTPLAGRDQGEPMGRTPLNSGSA